MGTFFAENFGNDAALDQIGEVLDGISSRLDEELDDIAIDEGFDEAMASVDIIRILCTQTPAAPPKPDVITKWQKRLLKVFDGQIDDLEPEEGFKEERRAVIVKTFDDLLALSKSMWKK